MKLVYMVDGYSLARVFATLNSLSLCELLNIVMKLLRWEPTDLELIK